MAWETIVAAVGGLLLGLGLGMSIGRRSAPLEVDGRTTDARIRTAVLPVLERRASELGLEPNVDPSDPVGTAVLLATAIRRSEPSREIAFSDTIEMDAKRVTKTVSQRPGPLG